MPKKMQSPLRDGGGPGTNRRSQRGRSTSILPGPDFSRYIREFIEAGIPVVCFKPDPKSTTGYQITPGWQHATPDHSVLDRYREGDALAIVAGRGLDVIDIDPRNGGSEEALEGMLPEVIARADTPSGGQHLFIRSLGVPKKQKMLQGIDLLAGHEGNGHILAFIAPTVRESKVTGEMVAYRWTKPPERLSEALKNPSRAEIPPRLLQALGEAPMGSLEDWEREQELQPGNRNNAVFREACKLRDAGFSEDTTVKMLDGSIWAEIDQSGFSRQEYLQAIHSAFSYPVSGSDGAKPGTGSTWQPLDLGEVVQGLMDGTYERPKPTIGPRDDDACLFYPGRVNGVAGDSNAGKTWTALYASKDELTKGNTVIYIDLEDDPAGIVSRLLDIGASADQIRQQFIYVRPDESFGTMAQAELLSVIEDRAPTLVVIDSVGEAMALDGTKPNEDDEVAQWFRMLPGLVARRGPAVLVLDHVPKNDKGSLYPIGSQRKRAAITGAQYTQEMEHPFSKNQAGSATLICTKDRHGNYSIKELVATFHVVPNEQGAHLMMKAPPTFGGLFRPTGLMRQVSDFIENATEPVTLREIRAGVEGNNKTIKDAIDVLVIEGYVNRQLGKNNSQLHTLIRPYRGVEEDFSTTDQIEELI